MLATDAVNSASPGRRRHTRSGRMAKRRRRTKRCSSSPITSRYFPGGTEDRVEPASRDSHWVERDVRRRAVRCVLRRQQTARTYGYGFTATPPFGCTSKWRWLAVVLPVAPTYPMTSPCETLLLEPSQALRWA